MQHLQAHPACEVDARASHHHLKWLSHTLLLKVKCWPWALFANFPSQTLKQNIGALLNAAFVWQHFSQIKTL